MVNCGSLLSCRHVASTLQAFLRLRLSPDLAWPVRSASLGGEKPSEQWGAQHSQHGQPRLSSPKAPQAGLLPSPKTLPFLVPRGLGAAGGAQFQGFYSRNRCLC